VPARARPRARVLALFALLLVAAGAALLLAAEVAARLRGVRPWSPEPVAIRVEPGGRLYERDEVLGYRLLPGRYTVTLESGHRFGATHGDDGLRRTRPQDTPPRPGARPLWIFGCSFTYGWSVDDAHAYPHRLQARRPDLDVVSFGVNGYGTLHSLLQLRTALAERRAAEVAVLAYGAFHDVRNTFLRARRKRVAPYSRLGPLAQPYARLHDGALRIEMAEVAYRPAPLTRVSAFAHLLEQHYNRLEQRLHDSRAVTRALVRAFAEEARAGGAQPLFVTITKGAASVAMRRFAAGAGIATADIAVDLERPGLRNLPHDGHPSPRAHRLYAARLERALARLGMAPMRRGSDPGP